MRTVRPALAAALAAALSAAAAGAGAELIAGGDPERGARVFQKCYACHSVDPAENELPGPNLAGVIGRPAAARPDFEYSPAMAAAARERALSWTPETLAAFVADPQAFLPGTSMAFVGLPDARERADLIAYLAASDRRR